MASATTASPRRVMIIAGEASGDQHGAAVVRSMKRREKTVRFFGIGGVALREAGVEVVVDAAQLSVVGITEAVARLPWLWEGIATAKAMLRERRPHLLILIDFPDFNLHVAGCAKRLGIPVLYYISPQVWAWRRRRVAKIRDRVDHIAVILPFEADFYRHHGVPVSFVGHPLADHYASLPAPGADAPAAPVLGLLPGSREREVVGHLPVMLDAARRIRRRAPALRVIVSAAGSVPADTIDDILHASGVAGTVEAVRGPVENVYRASTLVVAVSGTVTLEAAFFATPLIIIYRVSRLSYVLGRLLIRVPYIGLINLLAEEEIAPELIQDEVTGRKIADTAMELIDNPRRLRNIRKRMQRLRQSMGGPGASRRVADLALAFLFPTR
jgi:lipid-A-disaccharide synthase